MKRPFWDAVLIGGILLIAGILWFFLRPGRSGAWVIVTVDGVETGRYSLHQDAAIVIDGDAGAYNILTISGGTATVTEANCGDHTCVRTGSIAQEGETIVCLPHRLIISIAGGERAFDALTQ